jgi:geranylgeranyl diphosphate synthase type II
MAPIYSSETYAVSNLLRDTQGSILAAFCGDDKQLLPDNPIHAAYQHHFRSLGSGTRVRLTHRCSEHLGIAEDDRRHLAAAIECLHNASLVQDDLQDQSMIRRGQPSIVAEFGSEVALGLTDTLITCAFACVAKINNHSVLPELIGQIHRAVSETTEGQTIELRGGPETKSIDARLGAARKKSGPLFALALELPLIVSGHQQSLSVAHEVACLFGLGYQLLDDLRDQVCDSESETNSNLVLAMKNESIGNSAESRAIELAQSLLQDAIHQAEELPQGMGTPLVDLIEWLLQQIDSFTPAVQLT